MIIGPTFFSSPAASASMAVFHDTFTDAEGTRIDLHTPDTNLTPNWVYTQTQSAGIYPLIINEFGQLVANPSFNASFVWVYGNLEYEVIALALPYRITVVMLHDYTSTIPDPNSYTKLQMQNDNTGEMLELGMDTKSSVTNIVVNHTGGVDPASETRVAASINIEYTISLLVEATQYTLSINGSPQTPVTDTAFADPQYIQILVCRGNSYIDSIRIEEVA